MNRGKSSLSLMDGFSVETRNDVPDNSKKKTLDTKEEFSQIPDFDPIHSINKKEVSELDDSMVVKSINEADARSYHEELGVGVVEKGNNLSPKFEKMLADENKKLSNTYNKVLARRKKIKNPKTNVVDDFNDALGIGKQAKELDDSLIVEKGVESSLQDLGRSKWGKRARIAGLAVGLPLTTVGTYRLLKERKKNKEKAKELDDSLIVEKAFTSKKNINPAQDMMRRNKNMLVKPKQPTSKKSGGMKIPSLRKGTGPRNPIMPTGSPKKKPLKPMKPKSPSVVKEMDSSMVIEKGVGKKIGDFIYDNPTAGATLAALGGAGITSAGYTAAGALGAGKGNRKVGAKEGFKAGFARSKYQKSPFDNPYKIGERAAKAEKRKKKNKSFDLEVIDKAAAFRKPACTGKFRNRKGIIEDALAKAKRGRK